MISYLCVLVLILLHGIDIRYEDTVIRVRIRQNTLLYYICYRDTVIRMCVNMYVVSIWYVRDTIVMKHRVYVIVHRCVGSTIIVNNKCP